MESIWSDAKRPKFETLNKNLKTDVLIIGGGITGILCAYMLEKSGVDYALVEADRICSGITQNTTAKITLQHSLIYDKLIHTVGTDKARQYFDVNRLAVEEYRNICETTDCDFKSADSYVYSLNNRRRLEKELEALQILNADCSFVADTPLPFAVAGAIKLKNQAQFHPLKFLFSIAKDLKIYEHTKVKELTPYGTFTNNVKITAKKIIVATHFPFLNKHGAFFLKLYQHRSYVLGLKNAPLIDGMYVDESEKGLSLRSYGDMLILGGGSHRTGKKGGNWRELEEFASRYYPGSEITYRWATQDCMSLDGIPYIGQYSKNTPNLFVATGFNKWGMTSAMVAAMILKDLVQGNSNPFADVFSPSRSIIKPQLFINAAETTFNLLTPTAPRCPHLGCALKYNKEEHTWDCPCHGSRFSEDGKLIDNPSTDDKKNM